MIRVPGVLLLVSWGNCWNGQGERSVGGGSVE